MGESKPLRGFVVCCSSIAPDERNRLAAIAVDNLGAVHTFDLTSAVTHLLVGSLDTPKTRFVARERPDIKVLLPEWLEAVNAQWMSGGEVDVAGLENQYTAPPFLNLKICLTGFDDLQERTRISDLARQHGAEYSGDLTRDVTHLIAAGPRGKKYEYAREWQIKTVGLEWMHQSIERGLALDELAFDLRIAPEERGKDAWRREAIQSLLGKRQRDGATAHSAQGVTRRRLRRAASEKFGSQTGALWADITSRASGSVDNDDWEGEQVDPINVQPNAASTTTAEQNIIGQESVSARQDATTKQPRKRPPPGIFAGCPVFVHGFDPQKTKILLVHLSSNGATLLNNIEELAACPDDDQADGFLMTPHDLVDSSLPPLPATQMQRVTEWWLEECLYAKALIDPSQAWLCKPLPIAAIPGLRDLVICSTGFQPIQVLHLSKLCPLVGASYDEYLKPTSSLLLADPEKIKQEKLDFAIEHAIPVVRLTWLKCCLHEKALQPLAEHLLPAFVAAYRRPLELLEVKVNPGARGKAPEAEVRPVEPANSKKPSAQLAPRMAEFRKPRAMNDASPSADLDTEQTKQECPDTDTTTVTAPLTELPFGSNGASRRSPLPRSPRSAAARRPTAKDGHAATFDGAASTDEENRVIPEPLRPESNGSEHLHNAITALLAQKQASRPSSAHETSNPIRESVEPRRRRRGILGRASSATSNPTGSVLSNLSRASSVSGLSQPDHQIPGPATQALQQPEASQALVYEDPKMQQEREDMIRSMGGKVQQSVLSKEPGVLRDVGCDQHGVAGRVKRKARETRGTAVEDGW